MVSLLYGALWIFSNIGIILNKVWDETCQTLFTYLLIMSFSSLGGLVIYLYLGIIRYASDTQWLLLSAGGALGSMALAAFMCWGVMQVIQQSGLLGAYQCFACVDSTGATVNGTCSSTDICASDSWRLIYSISDCEPATVLGIYCELSDLCVYSAENTFWYATLVTAFYLIVLIINGLAIFLKLIPSLAQQSGYRSRLV